MQAAIENNSLEAVAEEYGIDAVIFEKYMENEGLTDMDEAADKFSDQFSGIWPDAAAWAEEMLGGTGELDSIPSHLRYYFDFSAYARDCQLGGDIWTLDTHEGTAIFWNR